MSLVNVLT